MRIAPMRASTRSRGRRRSAQPLTRPVARWRDGCLVRPYRQSSCSDRSDKALRLCYGCVEMITVGCAGFAVPATRYFKEYRFVEIQETHRTTPGPGTIRRWRREAPEGFQFAVLGPREVSQEGFRQGKIVETALDGLVEVAHELDARTAVFVANPDFTPNRANRAALKDFLGEAKRRFPTVIFETGSGWDA